MSVKRELTKKVKEKSRKEKTIRIKRKDIIILGLKKYRRNNRNTK